MRPDCARLTDTHRAPEAGVPDEASSSTLDTCPDCDGVRGFLTGTSLTPAALHIAYGVARGGWCCDHVDWTWEDAANAYQELWRQEVRWRDQLRAALPSDHPAQTSPSTRRMMEMAADG